MVARKMVSTVAEGEEWIENAEDSELKELLYSFTSLEVSQFFSASFNASNAIKYAIKDGYVIPSDGFDVIRTGNYNKIPLFMGSCASEESGFILNNGYFKAIDDAQGFLANPEKLQLASTIMPYVNKLYAGYNIDATARALALAQSESIYCYRFLWGTDASVTENEDYSKFIGAHHGADIDFYKASFGNNHPEFGEVFYPDNLPGRTALSTNMIKYLANFIYSSNPNGTGLTKWDSWNSGPALMNFNASKTADISKMSNDIYKNEYIWPELEKAVDNEFLNKYVTWRFFGMFRNLFWWIDETFDSSAPAKPAPPMFPDDDDDGNGAPESPKKDEVVA